MVIQIFKTFDGSAKAKGKVPCFATHYLEENSTMGRGGQRINHQRWVEVVNALIISNFLWLKEKPTPHDARAIFILHLLVYLPSSRPWLESKNI
jgi:hypothetical protein